MCNPVKKSTTVEIFRSREALLKDMCDERSCLSAQQTAEWALSNPCPEDTKIQCVEEEVSRLMNLKKYSICGVEGEESIDRLTSIAASMFNTPMSVVSLVDLRRLWFLSAQGFGDLREIPRADTLCSHCICNTNDILVIPDCQEDERFKNLFTVVGEPHLRFYAGACMKSPEGYNLGNFCILDVKPHPEGLTEVQKKVLMDFAATTVKLIVDRHYRMEMEEKNSQMIAQTSHDLLTPLSGLQLSLAMLKDDPDLGQKMNDEHKELINTAKNCAELMNRICTSAIEDLRSDSTKRKSSDKSQSQSASLAELVQNLNQIGAKIPKHVPLHIHIDKSAQGALLYDDLPVFRAALCYLSAACVRTYRGSVHMKILARNNELVFECRDSAPRLSSHDRENLFLSTSTKKLDDSNLAGFRFVTTLLRPVGGSVGYESLSDDAGSLVWFSIPFPQEREKVRSSQKFFMMEMPQTIAQFKRNADQNDNDDDEISSHDCNKRRRISNPSLSLTDRSFLSQNHERNSFSGSALQSISANTQKTSSMSNALPVDKSNTDIVHDSSPALGQSLFSTVTQRTKKALVVDDSLVIRKSVGKSLVKVGFEVELAEDGLQGLDKMKEQMFDVVLCDFLMPVMDGLDCVKQYREWEKVHRPDFHQYILGISAHANADDLDKGIEAGMDKYVSKPIPFKMLKDMPMWDPIQRASKKLDKLMCVPDSNQVGAKSFHVATISRSEADSIVERESSTVVSNYSMEESRTAIFAGDNTAMEERIQRLEKTMASLVDNVNPFSSLDSFSTKRRDSLSQASRLMKITSEKATTNFGRTQSRSSCDPMKLQGPLFENLFKSRVKQTKETASPYFMPQKPRYCLVATNKEKSQPLKTTTILASNGWKCTEAHGSEETLQFLKMRQWDAVIINEELGPISAAHTIKFFRVWERESHRMHRQNNVLFECSSLLDDGNSDENLIIQAPLGFDGVVRQHLLWKDLNRHMDASHGRVNPLRTESSSHNFRILTH